ncbi:MAG: hypothetical protein ACI8XC_001823, partial [Gammaproteobacteria bacterium]
MKNTQLKESLVDSVAPKSAKQDSQDIVIYNHI